jgi:hypothetical protein
MVARPKFMPFHLEIAKGELKDAFGMGQDVESKLTPPYFVHLNTANLLGSLALLRV